MNLESRLVLGDDMARQVATYGERQHADVVCSRIDAVTTDDLIRVAKRGLKSKGPISYLSSHLQTKKNVKRNILSFSSS